MDIIKFKLLHEDAKVPHYATKGSAGADLTSVEEVFIDPGCMKMVSVGLAMEIEPGYEVQIRPRSGIAYHNWVTVLNTPGTVDSDYRGEIKVLLFNHGEYPYHVTPGMRIAQMVVNRVYQPNIMVVEDLSSTDRGEGGMGSTGVKEAIKKVHGLANVKLRGEMYGVIAELAIFLSSKGYIMSGDELVDFFNRNDIKKKNGGSYRKGRGIYGTIKHAYKVCVESGMQDVADAIADVFKSKNGDNPWG
jgi:dUTP pyrophosphatase